jgi:hypothetical protein
MSEQTADKRKSVADQHAPFAEPLVTGISLDVRAALTKQTSEKRQRVLDVVERKGSDHG